MLDRLPLEIQLEIMKRLPVKSLLQFRSVSKAWRSRIDSSAFVAHYNTQMQHLLVAYEKEGDDNPNFVSIADDHTFPHQKVSPTVPSLVNMLTRSRIIGSSRGLVCLHGVYPKSREDSISKKDVVVLWNPSIRRAIAVAVPNVVYGMYRTFFGFGVCRATADPKIVKITLINTRSDVDTIISIPWQVEVFTLSTGVWRSSCINNVPRKSVQVQCLQVVVDGFIYWRAIDRIRMDGGYTSYYLIISFDITTEEFREVNLPHCLAQESRSTLYMSTLKESLAVLHQSVDANNPVIDVWVMEDGVPKLFTKLFTINVNIPDVWVMGFRESGEPIIEIFEDDLLIFKLVVYDPYSKLINYLDIEYFGINGIACGISVYPYMETLLLLDQPNVAAYNEMETIRFLDDLVS